MSPRYLAARSDSRMPSRMIAATSLSARSPWIEPRLRLYRPSPSISRKAREKGTAYLRKRVISLPSSSRKKPWLYRPVRLSVKSASVCFS